MISTHGIDILTLANNNHTAIGHLLFQRQIKIQIPFPTVAKLKRVFKFIVVSVWIEIFHGYTTQFKITKLYYTMECIGNHLMSSSTCLYLRDLYLYAYTKHILVCQVNNTKYQVTVNLLTMCYLI